VLFRSAIAEGADAVVMIENTQSIDSTLEISKSVGPGENLVRVGDDIRVGHNIFRRGHLVRPQDIGVLAALGIAQIAVFQPPRVAIISAGDEVISPDKTPLPGQVRDINTYTLSALVRQAGGVPLPQGIMKDDFESLSSAARRAILAAEILIISSGSSVSTRDMTSRVISDLGKPGVLVHGVSLRPGKPTILAAVEGKPVLGLPGNPVSAMVVFDLFARPIIYRVAGCDTPPLPPTVTARLTRNIPSTTGREDYVPVSLEMTEDTLFATPIFGESNLITTLVQADGVAKVPLDKHGLTEGEMVSVRIF
jgi:molybdopterin molybdotransferase